MRPLSTLLLLLAAATPLRAQGPSLAFDTLTIASRAIGEPRPINVHLPVGYDRRGTTRYQVLYVPDGGVNEDLPHVIKTVDSLTAAGQIRPVIIVGIPNTERRRDMTGPTRFKEDSAIAPRVGGSAAFRAFIRDELIPAIDARYRTTKERSIIGESLAGLFIMEIFLREPALFTHYVALDPSFWWNGGALADSARHFFSTPDSATHTLYLATSNVAEIADPTARVVQALNDGPPRRLTWEYSPRTDLTHGTIYLALAPESLINALK